MKALQLRLRRRWEKALFVAAIAAPSFAFVAYAGRLAIARYLANTGTVENVLRACSLDAPNPEYQLRLALLYQWVKADVLAARAAADRAVELGPHRSVMWTERARSCFAAGDLSCADRSYETAVRLAPNVPRYRVEAFNYYLVTGREAKALAHVKYLLTVRRDFASMVFDSWMRAGGSLSRLWAEAVDQTSGTDIRLAYIGFLSSIGNVDQALEYWPSVLMTKQPIEYDSIRPFLDHLLQIKRYNDAFSIWQDLLHRRDIADRSLNNLVYNGDFAQPPLNSGFDWHFARTPFVDIGVDEMSCFSAAQCVRVDFTVPTNEAYEPIYELVRVEPSTDYTLEAVVRSNDITSTSGIELRVRDEHCPDCILAKSVDLKGSTAWHNVTVRFVTAPATQFVRLSLYRERSRAYPVDIAGQFWIGSVRLSPTRLTDHVTERPSEP